VARFAPWRSARSATQTLLIALPREPSSPDRWMRARNPPTTSAVLVLVLVLSARSRWGSQCLELEPPPVAALPEPVLQPEQAAS